MTDAEKVRVFNKLTSNRGMIERAFIAGIRAAIAAHGPIDESNAASAAKRCVGELKGLIKALSAKELIP